MTPKILVRIWEATTGTLVVTVPAPAIANALDLDFAPDGSALTASGTYGILTFDTATWTQIRAHGSRQKGDWRGIDQGVLRKIRVE